MARNERTTAVLNLFGALPGAGAWLAGGWWTALLLRGLLPAVFAIAMGPLVGAVQHGDALGRSLALTGALHPRRSG